MKDLNRYVTMKYAADWYNIGIELGLEYGILNRIERNHSQSITCFRKTLQEWLKLNNNDATWRTLEVVLTNVNRVKVGLDPVNSVYGKDIYLHLQVVLECFVFCMKIFVCLIKTHGRVSVAKKDVQHTNVLFTGTTKSPFSTPCISITTRLIYIRFTYFMPFIYTILHTKFEENRRSSL